MKTMPSTSVRTGYRAASTVSLSPAVAVSDTDSAGFGSSENRCDPLGHHENLTTSSAHGELNGKAPRADGWVAFATKAIFDNRGSMEGDCVRWASFITKAGYAEVRILGKCYPAHRLVAALTYGPEAVRGKDVHHTCGVRDCTNAAHLLPVTHSEHASIHKGVDAPPFPPDFFGEPSSVDVIAVMSAGRKFRRRPWRDTPQQNLERARLRRLVLVGILAEHRVLLAQVRR